MTQTALADLLARVEEMTGPLTQPDEIFDLNHKVFPDAQAGARAHLVGALTTGSLDAAVAFCEAVLPGWFHGYGSDGMDRYREGPFGCVGNHELNIIVEAWMATPALALVLAVLKALQAKTETPTPPAAP
jgi:hypothetical protein